MKKIKSVLNATGWLSSLFLVVGCQSPAITVTNSLFGINLDDNMKGRNLGAAVAWDEQWAGLMTSPARNQLYAQGIAKGTPEFNLRVVRVNTRFEFSGLFESTGDRMWLTSAVVPDHLPKLHMLDIVEVRQTDSFQVNKDFASKGEGNIVVRILCKYGTPDYEACLDRQPRIGKHRGFGETNTPYPVSIKEYGFTYTPMYDAEGRAIR